MPNLNPPPLIKCACMFCDCDSATTASGVCYECDRGLHALNEWKDGRKLRVKPKPPLEPDFGPMPDMINKIAKGEFKKLNIDNAEMTVRLEVVLDLLAEILKYSIVDIFDGKKCKLCGYETILDMHYTATQEHELDCPLRKIPGILKEETNEPDNKT